MIKLIATDVDGTLVKDSSPRVYPEIFEEIRRLKEKGIICAIASGRQYHSVAAMFAPVAENLIFIVENGAHIRCRDTDISVMAMKNQDAEEIIRDIRCKGLDMVVSTPRGSLLESKNQEFIDLIINGYRNKAEIVSDVLSEKREIIKVAAYRKNSIREVGESFFIPKWAKRCKTCMAGEEWVDFMDSQVDKGNALKTVQDFFHISKAETMVFGDNGNDIGMLQVAEESYAVDTARENVKQFAKHICGGYEKKGVLEILKSI